MAAMESWGTELWDKYSELTSHAHNGIDFLENYVARCADGGFASYSFRFLLSIRTFYSVTMSVEWIGLVIVFREYTTCLG